MIFVHDKGRMANNMLQYGHVYAWGREHCRKTMSMRFAYKYPYFNICNTPHHNFPTYLFAKYAAKWGLIPLVQFNDEDGDYTHEEQIMLNSKLVMATGWYARWYDLFLKYKEEIINLFSFKEEIERRVTDIMGERKGLPSAEEKPETLFYKTSAYSGSLRLGVHIRRGDYANFYGGRFFYSDEQYVRIIQRFCSLFPKEQIQVYICGNDPKIQKGYYHSQLEKTDKTSRQQPVTVVFPEGNPGEDLCLLSHCDYLIGAPSTFSLVASLYHDLPLYWIEDADKEFSTDDFRHFDYLFRHIY